MGRRRLRGSEWLCPWKPSSAVRGARACRSAGPEVRKLGPEIPERVGSGGAAAAEDLSEILPGVTALRLGYLLRRACRDDAAALVAALWTDVHDPVRALDHVEVVLDHQHGVARLDQPVEHVQETLDVVEVKAGGGLVEDVERPAGVGAGQLAREFDALRFAAAQGR